MILYYFSWYNAFAYFTLAFFCYIYWFKFSSIDLINFYLNNLLLPDYLILSLFSIYYFLNINLVLNINISLVLVVAYGIFVAACGIWSSDQESIPGSLHWEGGDLATRPAEKSPQDTVLILIFCCSFPNFQIF